MTRPSEIVWFERIIIATLVLGVFNSWIAWPQMAAMSSPAFVISIQLFTFAVMIGLTLLIVRRRSNVAKWVFIALYLIGLPMVAQQIMSGALSGSLAITFIQAVAQAVAFVLLFTPSSRHWLKSGASAASA